MEFIQDTTDVLLTRKSDGYKIFTGSTQSVGVTQSVEEELVKGGIGNAPQYTIKASKELEITVKDALFDFNWLAATQGVKVKDDKSITIEMTEIVALGKSGEVKIKDQTATAAVVIGADGANHKATFSKGTATVSGLADVKEGTNVTVIFDKTVEKGKTIAIRSDRFAEKYKAQLYTVAYDKDTEKISKDVYGIFEYVTPSSEFDMSFEAGSAMSPEIKLRATADPKTKEIGKWVLVDHVEEDEAESL